MRRSRRTPSLWPRIALYGALLAAGTLALEWFDYLRLTRSYPAEVFLFLVAAGFLALGVLVGARALRPPAPQRFDGNPKARAALGISARELAVLEALAEGRSNKEIAAALAVSTNTVKTHVAHLFEKLDASRRTEAVSKARALGIVP